MMSMAPSFWSDDGIIARMLSPASAIGAAITARRVGRRGWRAPVPVVCCGNATVGGAGKTTLVLDLARRLTGHKAHILLRGYGGSLTGPHRVMPDDPVGLVGDEALLLTQLADTWIGADRAASAKAAVAAGARLLLMDDGLQNPTLLKTISILVIDGISGFGNGRVLPAGPLREPVAAAAARCHLAVLVGEDLRGALSLLPPGLPVLRADLVQDPSIAALVGQRVIAFAGIARPAKFFDPLRKAGVLMVAAHAFPDHHLLTAREQERLLQEARDHQALLVTTPKDAVRLPTAFRDEVTVVGVDLIWRKPEQIDQLLDTLIAALPNDAIGGLSSGVSGDA